MTDEQQKILEVYLQEYGKLKDEQSARIGFRDNLLYVTLGVFGGVISFALSNQTTSPDAIYALLVLPWVCLILGWTYLVNDEKISALGKYIRDELAGKISLQMGHTENKKFIFGWEIFGWEIEHRSDKHRKRRKIEQLFINEIAFVFSGMVGLIAFHDLAWQSGLWTKSNGAIQFLCWTELSLLIILGVEIFVYADLGKGR